MPTLQDVLQEPRAASRTPDHASEAAALHRLAQELEKPQGDVLGMLGEQAMALCDAGSAGVSILEMGAGEPVFRWYGVRGAWARYAGGSLPMNASPCGLVIQRRSALLFRHPERHFADIRGEPPISEVLLAPFFMMGEPVGTVWVLHHDESRHFDSEHVRIVESLARFAGHAFLVRTEIDIANGLRDEALRRAERLARTLASLTGPRA